MLLSNFIYGNNKNNFMQVHRIVIHVCKFITFLNYFVKNEVTVVCFVVKTDESSFRCFL